MTHVKVLSVLWQTILGSVFLVQPLLAAFEYPGLGWTAAAANIRIVGVGHLDRWVYNPALLDDLRDPGVALEIHRPYQGLGLQATALSGNFKLGRMPLVAAVTGFGDDLYSEIMASAGFSRSLALGVRVGGSVHYAQVQMAGATCFRSISLTPALVLRLGDGLEIGTSLQHLTQLNSGGALPQHFSCGLAYSQGGFQLLTSLEKEGALPVELKLALIQRLGSSLELAAGYIDPEGILSWGWRLHAKRFSVFYAWQGHPHLPVSQGLGLGLELP